MTTAFNGTPSWLRYGLALAVCGFAALALGLALPWELRLHLHARASPMIAQLFWLASAALLLAAFGLRVARAEARDRAWLMADLAFALSLVMALAVLVPARALIEGDESNIALTAQRIAAEGRADAGIAGVYLPDGSISATDIGLDKRGVALSAVAALVAPWFADTFAAIQALNLALGLVALYTLIRYARRYGSHAWPWLAALALVSSPVAVLCMRSSGFDLANLAGLLVLVHLAHSHWHQPSTLRAAALALVAATLAQIRTEALLIASLVLIALYLRALAEPQSRRPFSLVCAPLLIVPAAWRLAVPFHYELDPGAEAMSFVLGLRNAQELFATAIWPGRLELTAPWVNAGGALAAGWLVWAFLKRRLTFDPALVALWAPFTLGLALVVAFYWGQSGNLITARYFIGLYAVAAILLSMGIGRIADSTRSLAFVLSVAVIAGVLVQIQRAVAADPFILQDTVQQREWTLYGLNQRFADCNLLLLHPYTVIWLARGVSAMPADRYLKASEAQRAFWQQQVQAVVYPVFRNPDGSQRSPLTPLSGGTQLGNWQHPAGWRLELNAVHLSDGPIDQCAKRPQRFGQVDERFGPPHPQWIDLRNLGPDQVMVR